LLDTGIARGIGSDGGGLFIAAGGAFGGNGVAFARMRATVASSVTAGRVRRSSPTSTTRTP
jgi:hypothetical protein